MNQVAFRSLAVLVAAASATAAVQAQTTYRIYQGGEGSLCPAWCPGAGTEERVAPFSKFSSCVWTPNTMPRGNLSYQATAERGWCSAEVESIHILSDGLCDEIAATASSAGGGLVFSGPPGALSVQSSFNVVVDWAPEFDSGFAINFVYAQLAGGTINLGQDLQGVASGVYSGPTIVLGLNSPYFFDLRSTARARSYFTPGGPGTARGLCRVHLPINRPVFNLPDGYTANCPDLNIVNNRWVPDASIDADADGVPDDIDNCPSVSNPSQQTADVDGVAGLSFQDIFSYLNAWFAGDMNMDWDMSGTLEIPDIFGFLNFWFAGC